MAELRLEGARIEIDRTVVLDGLDVTIPEAAFVAVVGPSGSGKSTLLRGIAGLVDLAYGRLTFDGVDVTRRPPGERDIGMVFQMPALLPRRNVRRNVSFPLEIRRQTVDAIRMRVDAETRAMHIEHLLLRRPDQLSRGEEQLVQIARAMVRTPRVLLLDEPFAPLDEHLRRRMRAEIRILQDGYGVTTLMATNDPDDVLALASSVIVLGDGGLGQPSRIVQVGPTVEVAHAPVSLEVASATGPIWAVTARVTADIDGAWLTKPDGAVRLKDWSPTLDRYSGRHVTVGFRTGDLTPDENGGISAVVDRIVPGSKPTLLCSVDGERVCATGHPGTARVGATIRLRAATWLLFDPQSGARIG